MKEFKCQKVKQAVAVVVDFCCLGSCVLMPYIHPRILLTLKSIKELKEDKKKKKKKKGSSEDEESDTKKNKKAKGTKNKKDDSDSESDSKQIAVVKIFVFIRI